MWWYNRLKIKLASKEEEHVVALDAQRIVRRRLYYQGNTNPSEYDVNLITNKVIDKLKTKFGNLNKIRRYSSSESLNPIIEEAVIEILP